MDRKRKSVFSVPGVNSKEARLNRGKSNASSSSTVTFSDEAISCPFDAVSDSINDALRHLHYLRSRDVELHPDILMAASAIDKALHRAKHHTSASTTCNGETTNKHAGATINLHKAMPVPPPIPDDALRKAVFTHPGVCNNVETTYDRLEVLGDAYIELIATKLIWEKFSNIPSGRISQIRELLVKNETLAEYATKYGFHDRAAVPQDYPKQPKRWTKTKGDIFEAYVAAVIISNPTDGYKMVEDWLTRLWLPKLSGIGNENSALNAKEILARKIMGKGIKLNYIDERQPIQRVGGTQIFFIGVYLTGWGWDNKHLGSGQGPNKVIAGNEAAKKALLKKELIEEIIQVKENEIRKV
ncbi:ribonuclease III domain-containing protein [Aspergillus avenaceus]|uniref:Ribonuclease III domain-containing protein n=1 Tax=Aspergillus avenaceus TaxID=36643 RepID=A0A5N6TNN3_ASPAV|nr:ribonuclease III domain-containing protein [Aspergillus avenaceus]